MKLQNLTVIFIIIIIPIILLVSLYITSGLKTLKYQSLYDTGLMTATHDAIYAFEQNSADDKYSSNPEIKRDILKSSIKMFEKSLANTCGISSYSYQEIEEYIPAIVFGMYDGFYMYAPSKEYTKDEDGNEKYEYKHNLKNYVYYSETLEDGTVIRYSLDNYVVVTGNFNGKYQTRGGYLAVMNGSSSNGQTYRAVSIIEENNLSGHEKDGIYYYEQAYDFTNWFLNEANMGSKAEYLNISTENDPEDENSAFVQHKREIIKYKIENVLNSSITAYSQRMWGKIYKMPKFSEEDWQKIYNNISMITFLQGKNIGLTTYNGYCVLNSTNSREYVNPNLMYFIAKDGYYHDIRCPELLNPENSSDYRTGYRIGKFEKKKVDKEQVQTDADGNPIYDEYGNIKTETVQVYEYDFEDCLACYTCINGAVENVSPYDYVRNTSSIKTSYFTSLGRERYNGAKPYKIEHDGESVIQEKYTLTFDENCMDATLENMPNPQVMENIISGTEIDFSGYLKPTRENFVFIGWSTDGTPENVIVNNKIKIESDETLYAVWSNAEVTLTFKDGEDVIKTETVYKGMTYTIIGTVSTEREGYRFIGWNESKTATNAQTQILMNGDKTVYAIWKKQVTLTFDANIPEGESYTGTLPSSKKLDQGSTFTLNSIGGISRAGYAFMGWSTNKNALSGQSTVKMDTDKTVYAVWRQYIAKYALQNILDGTETDISFYSSLQDAVNVINVGSTKKKVITLLTDITENITIRNDDDRVLNLNGKTLTGNILNNSINLTVENGNINGKFENFETGGAKELIFNNVTIDGKSQSAIYRVSGSTGYWNVEFNNCTITSYNGTATIEEVNDNITINNTTISNTGQGHAIRLKRKTGSAGGGTITINSGTITNSSASKQTIYLQDHDGGYECKLTMSGGTIQNSGNGGEIHGGKNSGIYISGGTVGNSSSNPTILIEKNAKLTISGGTIQNLGTGYAIRGNDFEKILLSGSCVVKNNSSTNATIYLHKVEDRVFDSSYTILDIDGGTITNSGGGYQIKTYTTVKDAGKWKYPTLDFNTSGYSISQTHS